MKRRKDLPSWVPMYGRKVCLDYKGIKKQCSACFGPHIRKFCLSKSLMTPPRYTPHPPNNHFFVARFSPFNFCLLIFAFNFASTFFHSISAIHFLLLNFNPFISCISKAKFKCIASNLYLYWACSRNRDI